MASTSIEFAGYVSGNTDFGTAYADPANSGSHDLLDAAVAVVVDTLNAGENPEYYVAIAVVGFSDRVDTAGVGCDERRSKEAEASLSRASSAWEWVKATVSSKLAAPIDQWWDTSNSVSWMMVPTGAAVLVHDPPASDAECAANRRVKVVFDFFGPVG